MRKSSILDIGIRACHRKVYVVKNKICFGVFGKLIAADEKNCYINKSGENC